jgi:transcriptional regulator NrdR family protein
MTEAYLICPLCEDDTTVQLRSGIPMQSGTIDELRKCQSCQTKYENTYVLQNQEVLNE